MLMALAVSASGSFLASTMPLRVGTAMMTRQIVDNAMRPASTIGLPWLCLGIAAGSSPLRARKRHSA
jgi:hypothetical protein